MKNFIIYLKSLWVNRIKPIKALKALRALAANKEDTVQVFHVIDALGGTNRRAFRDFKKSDVGKNVLENKIHLINTLTIHNFVYLFGKHLNLGDKRRVRGLEIGALDSARFADHFGTPY